MFESTYLLESAFSVLYESSQF